MIPPTHRPYETNDSKEIFLQFARINSIIERICDTVEAHSKTISNNPDNIQDTIVWKVAKLQAELCELQKQHEALKLDIQEVFGKLDLSTENLNRRAIPVSWGEWIRQLTLDSSLALVVLALVAIVFKEAIIKIINALF